jgi:release factor glutamine methyltransferase
MDVRTALKSGIAQLREAEVPSFTLAVELLLLHVLGRDRTWIYAHPEAAVESSDADRFFGLIARRVAGEPTQHLTGKQEFWGLEFEVTPDVLIPRPETEHVVEVALDRLAIREVRAGRPQKFDGTGLLIADIGTGSGCIAIALAKELPAAKFYATDISAAALEVACRNAARHGVADRVNFVEANLLERSGEWPCAWSAQDQRVASGEQRPHAAPRLGKVEAARPHSPPIIGHSPLLFDLIASNPPYVGRNEVDTLPREVHDHEPAAALYGGEEGYELYAPLTAQAAAHLKPGGMLVLELGHASLPAVQPLLESPQWTNVSVTNDLAGIPRVIAAEKKLEVNQGRIVKVHVGRN